jgi:hypothetical protein
MHLRLQQVIIKPENVFEAMESRRLEMDSIKMAQRLSQELPYYWDEKRGLNWSKVSLPAYDFEFEKTSALIDSMRITSVAEKQRKVVYFNWRQGMFWTIKEILNPGLNTVWTPEPVMVNGEVNRDWHRVMDARETNTVLKSAVARVLDVK